MKKRFENEHQTCYLKLFNTNIKSIDTMLGISYFIYNFNLFLKLPKLNVVRFLKRACFISIYKKDYPGQ